MKDFWERLTSTQQMMLLLGASVAFVFILVQWVIFPIIENHTRTKSALAANQRILKQLIPMTAEYWQSETGSRAG